MDKVKSFFDSLSNGEITVLASVVSALIAAGVSILTTRYTLRHGPNYKEQIDSIHKTIDALAKTQEELRKQQANQAAEEKRRYEDGERRAEQARWKPEVKISSTTEGNQWVNKLVLKSNRAFSLLEVSLVSLEGAKMFDYPMNKPVVFTTGFGVPITDESLSLFASSSSTHFNNSSFDVKLRYRVSLEVGGGEYVGEIPFRAQFVQSGSGMVYKLSG